MEFDWREYLALAKKLKQSGDEAALRTAISRSYYCLYHLCNDFAKANSYSEKIAKGRSLHKTLWNWCETHEDPRVRELGVDGNLMRTLRNKADYESLPIEDLRFKVDLQLQKVEEYEALVRHLLPQ